MHTVHVYGLAPLYVSLRWHGKEAHYSISVSDRIYSDVLYVNR